jgi:hypothetical protein
MPSFSKSQEGGQSRRHFLAIVLDSLFIIESQSSFVFNDIFSHTFIILYFISV